MAERRLRFRKNEAPAKEVERETPPPAQYPVEASPARLLGKEAARTMMASAVHREDPPPAQNIPVGRANEEIEEWYIPVAQEDFVDIRRRGGHTPVASGLTRREAQTIIAAHNAAVARIKARTPTAAANPVPMPSPAGQPAPRQQSRPARLREANVEVIYPYREVERDVERIGTHSVPVPMGPCELVITIHGEGDLRGLLEETARRLDENGSPVAFSFRRTDR